MLRQCHIRRPRSNQELRLPRLDSLEERTMKLALSLITAGLVVVAFSLAADDRTAPAPQANNRLAASALLDRPAKPGTPAAPGEKAAEKLREGTRLTDEVGGFTRV